MPTPQDFNDFETSAPVESGEADAGMPLRGVAHTAAVLPAGAGLAASSSSAGKRDGASLAPSPGTPEVGPVAADRIERLSLPPLPEGTRKMLRDMEGIRMRLVEGLAIAATPELEREMRYRHDLVNATVAPPARPMNARRLHEIQLSVMAAVARSAAHAFGDVAVATVEDDMNVNAGAVAPASA